MARKPYRLPSGLIEGSPEANAAELAESARLDALLGLAPKSKAQQRRLDARARNRDVAPALARVGINLAGGTDDPNPTPPAKNAARAGEST